MRIRINLAIAALILSINIFAPALALAASAPTLQKPSVACVSGNPQTTIAWNKVTGATSYSVFRLEKPQTLWLTRYSMIRGIVETDKYVKNSVTYEYQVTAHFASSTTYSNIVSLTTPDCATSQTPTPSPAPTTTPATSSGNEKTFTAYITGYGWPDNTPPSATISNPVIHSIAGGTGTFSDPITIATGHSIISGKDILDYAAGTKFYIPALRRYFIVEDTCGDGNTPQDGPCHTGYQGHVWLDAWVGGTSAQSSATLACEDTITDFHTIIENPASNYLVTAGPVFDGTCSSVYGETALTD
jgi:hypothetical protein